MPYGPSYRASPRLYYDGRVGEIYASLKVLNSGLCAHNEPLVASPGPPCWRPGGDVSVGPLHAETNWTATALKLFAGAAVIIIYGWLLFTKTPLILSFSAQARPGVLASFAAAPLWGCGRGEGTPELSPRVVRASSLPAASACGCCYAEMQARQGELAGRETE
jgi:hypothetical protein